MGSLPERARRSLKPREALLLIAFCAGTSAGQQPSPVPSATPVELSILSVPIRSSIAPLVPLVEAQVPKMFRDTMQERGFSVQYDVVRDRIGLQMAGAGLHATTVAHYAVQACAGRLPCISCGVDERRRDAVLSLHSHFTWDRNWRIHSATTAQPAHFPNRCQVTLLNIDITDRYIGPVINRQLRDAAAAIDRNTPGLTNLKPIAQQIWSFLQTPTEISPRTWLVFDPVDAALGAITGSGLQVSSTLTIRARTRVLVGDKPVTVSRPLPDLVSGQAAGNIRVPLDVELSYDEANKLANDQFGGRVFKLSTGELRIASVRFVPAKAGRIGVEADVDYRAGRLSSYAGPVSLEGVPRFDAATSTIVVPDLDFTVAARGRSVFFRIAERVAHDAVRDHLRESTRFPMGRELTEARQEIDRALNRQIANGVILRGRVTTISPESVRSAPEAVVMRVVVGGEAEVVADSWQ